MSKSTKFGITEANAKDRIISVIPNIRDQRRRSKAVEFWFFCDHNFGNTILVRNRELLFIKVSAELRTAAKNPPNIRPSRIGFLNC